MLTCAEFIKGWNLCQLEVLECKRVPWPNALLEEKYGIEDINWPNKEFAYECKVNLLTGRTHQVMIQIRAFFWPCFDAYTFYYLVIESFLKGYKRAKLLAKSSKLAELK